MSRDYSKRNMAVWRDPDYRRLPFAAQALYNLLWDHPQLSYCGVVEWRPGRLAAMVDDLTPELIETLGDCLEARYFIIRDPKTEEALIRSWVRFDGLMKQPRLAVSYANAYGAVSSNDIRAVVIDELHRLREREPDLVGLRSSAVTDMWDYDRVSAKERPVPMDPFAQGFGVRFGYDLGPSLAQTSPSVSPSVSVPPTPAPAPTPLKEPTPSRGTRIPDDFPINDQMRAWAEKNIPQYDFTAEHDNFCDYWAGVSGKNALKTDWVRTWMRWMRTNAQRAAERSNVRQIRSDAPQRSNAEAWID